VPLHVGYLELDLYLRESRSLKERRRVVRGLLERLRARHNVAVVELSEDRQHQRGTLGIVSLATAREPLERLFDRLVEEAERVAPGSVREAQREMLS
jgi:uncharacterized protein YlxP (DUF503 family)